MKVPEEVKQAREKAMQRAVAAFEARGEEVGNAKKLREEMKKFLPRSMKLGDQGVIHTWLEQWRLGQETRTDAIELAPSAELLRLFRSEVRSFSAQASAEAERRIDGLLVDAQDLASRATALDHQVHELNRRLALLTTERDEAMGAASEARAHTERVIDALDDSREREAATAMELMAAESNCASLREQHRQFEIKSSKELSRLQEMLASEAARADAATASAEAATQRAVVAEAFADAFRTPGLARRRLRPGQQHAPTHPRLNSK